MSNFFVIDLLITRSLIFSTLVAKATKRLSLVKVFTLLRPFNMIYELSKKTLFGYKDVAEFDVYHHAIVSESYVI